VSYIRIFDIETSGFDGYRDCVAEVAWVEVDTSDPKWPITNSGHYYVNNPGLKVMPEGAFNVHGLSAQFLKNNGITFEEARVKIFKDLARQNVLGYNIKFDVRFLTAKFYKTLYEPYFSFDEAIDIMPIAKRVMKVKSGYKLTDALIYFNISNDITDMLTKKYFNYESPKAHNAGWDVIATYRLAKYFAKKGGLNDVF